MKITKEDINYLYNKIYIFYLKMNEKNGYSKEYDFGQFNKYRCFIPKSLDNNPRIIIFCSIFYDMEAYNLKTVIDIPDDSLSFEMNLDLTEHKMFKFDLNSIPFNTFEETVDYILPPLLKIISEFVNNVNKRKNFMDEILDLGNIREHKLSNILD